MTLYLVGGGPAVGANAVIDEFCQAAQQIGNRIGLALLGDPKDSADLVAEYTQPIKDRWPQAEFELIWLGAEAEPDGEAQGVEQAAANQVVWPEKPEYLAGLIVAAGWTPGYLDALIGSKDLIRTLVRRRVPYLGWSAGAMIVGSQVIAGGWQHKGRRIALEVAGEGSTELDIRPGLGLIAPAIETHADEQFIVARAIAVLEHSEVRSVVAIDEDTCLKVDVASGKTWVMGPGQITWLERNGDQVALWHTSGQPQKPDCLSELAPLDEELTEQN